MDTFLLVCSVNFDCERETGHKTKRNIISTHAVGETRKYENMVHIMSVPVHINTCTHML